MQVFTDGYAVLFYDKAQEVLRHAPSKDIACDLTDANLSEIKPVDWTSDLHIQIAKDVILALAATAVCNTNDIREQLLNHTGQNNETAIALSDFIGCFEKKTRPKDDRYNIIAYYLGNLMAVDDINPDEMFIVTYRIWEWLFHTDFKDVVEDVITDYLAQRWKQIIEHQRFNLRQPMLTIPDIETAIGDSTRGTVKIAKLLLAAEIAVKQRFSANLRSKLNEHCLQDQRGEGKQKKKARKQ